MPHAAEPAVLEVIKYAFCCSNPRQGNAHVSDRCGSGHSIGYDNEIPFAFRI